MKKNISVGEFKYMLFQVNWDGRLLPEGLAVGGGGLDLSGTGIVSLPENLTVDGLLYLSGTNIASLPEGLVVGDDLYLDNTDILNRLPEGLKIGGEIIIGGDVYSIPARNRLREGDYAEGRYLFADGILAPIRKRKQFGEYTVYIGKNPGHNVVSDGTCYAHCNKIRDGIV